MTWLLGNRTPSERHPGRQPLAARTVAVAAVAALALAGCGGAASTSHASATATNASPANSTRPSECVFSSQYGPGVTDCTSADPTVATDLYSDGNCSTTTNRITISWGDRSQDQTVTITGPSTANSPKLEGDHTYSRHGSYTLTVSGTITSGQCTYNPPTATYTFTYTPAVVASQVDCTRQNPSACLLASNAVAGLDAGDDSDAPTGMEMKAHDVTTMASQGRSSPTARATSSSPTRTPISPRHSAPPPPTRTRPSWPRSRSTRACHRPRSAQRCSSPSRWPRPTTTPGST